MIAIEPSKFSQSLDVRPERALFMQLILGAFVSAGQGNQLMAQSLNPSPWLANQASVAEITSAFLSLDSPSKRATCASN